MANAVPTLQELLLRLVQTLQFGWFVGHVSMLFFTFRYVLYYVTFKSSNKWAGFSYRTAFVSALVTYGIVVYKGYRARVRAGRPTNFMALIADENVQYLLMASVWAYSRQLPLALLPFVVYSVFHVATYIRSNILPAIQSPTTPAAGQSSSTPNARPKATGPVADAIGNFIKEWYDTSMTIVAVLELALWFRLLGSAVLFTKGSWILLGLYSVFLRARFAQSSFVQNAIANLSARGDAAFANKTADPRARNAWEQAKGAAKSVHDATDLGKYTKGTTGEGAKKAQ